jgi:hypothetical protein
MKTRNEIMTEAHKIARTLEGNYSARMSMALEIVWKMECVNHLDTATLQAQLTEGNFEAEIICKVVSFFSTTFKADIANNFLNKGFRMTEKQAWCVAYEFKNVA